MRAALKVRRVSAPAPGLRFLSRLAQPAVGSSGTARCLHAAHSRHPLRGTRFVFGVNQGSLEAAFKSGFQPQAVPRG